jgi:hypothetical protein
VSAHLGHGAVVAALQARLQDDRAVTVRSVRPGSPLSAMFSGALQKAEPKDDGPTRPNVRNPRIALAAGTLGAIVVAAIVVVALGGSGGSGGSDGGGSGERPNAPTAPLHVVKADLSLQWVRPDPGYDELVVSLTVPRLNSLQTTGGARKVLLRCFDGHGIRSVRQQHPWPLPPEAGYPLPHLHQPALAAVLADVRSCRLTGPGIDFAGHVRGWLRPAQ